MAEYSGMKFALFMMGEYVGMISVSLIATTVFFGGYQDGFGLVDKIPILAPFVLATKVILCLFGFVWVRGTLPRIRYDRLMTLGWKMMLPLGFLAVAWTAVAVVVGDELGSTAYGVISAVFLILVVGGVFAAGMGRSGEPVEENGIETDPAITGERGGLGYNILMLVGGIIALPFVLYNFTLRALDNLAKLAEESPESGSRD